METSQGKLPGVVTTVLEWVNFLWDRKKTLILAFFVSALLGLGTGFLIPKQYTATASILPSSSGSGLSSLLASTTGLSLGGLNDGSLLNSSNLYPHILKSRRLLMGVLDSDVDGQSIKEIVAAELGGKPEDFPEQKLVNTVREYYNIRIDPRTGYITLVVTFGDPVVAAELLNSALHNLDEFFRNNMKTSASDQRVLIENRIIQVEDSLKHAEEKLLDFREHNMRIDQSPTLLLQSSRLEREVQIQGAVYIELKKQLEVARIEELRQAPVLNVLDFAVAPYKKSYPSRLRVLVSFLFFGLLLTVIYLKMDEVGWTRGIVQQLPKLKKEKQSDDGEEE